MGVPVVGVPTPLPRPAPGLPGWQVAARISGRIWKGEKKLNLCACGSEKKDNKQMHKTGFMKALFLFLFLFVVRRGRRFDAAFFTIMEIWFLKLKLKPERVGLVIDIIFRLLWVKCSHCGY